MEKPESKSPTFQESVPLKLSRVPSVPGPLLRLQSIRSHLLRCVEDETFQSFSDQQLDVFLGEALYLERLRLSRNRGNFFTRGRLQGDQKLWRSVQEGLLKPAAEVDRKTLLSEVIRHYAEEIGGYFDPSVYELATHAIPFGFSWLLNAASVRRFLPWGMTESLQSRIRILGEVESLQRLAKLGTILLVPTHQSNMDSLLIGYVIYLMSLPPFSYGAGLNLFSDPVLSFFMRRLGAYTVDRNKGNSIYKQTLKNYSTQILKEGIHSIFFPGGSRARSGAIESHLKLGLLGTGLDAQIQGTRVFVVPMVVSYHYVLEAGSLIENYLAEAGKHKFIPVKDETWQDGKVLNFFWKTFSSQSSVTVRIGQPLDIFGNFVNQQGESLGADGLKIDASRWLMSAGEFKRVPQRDQEYTQQLGTRLVDRFHKENTVLTSHLVAFSFFETLRNKYPDFDLFRFLRLSLPQRTLPWSDFLEAAEHFHQRVMECSQRGGVFLSEELQNTKDPRVWIRDGVRQLGVCHNARVVRVSDQTVWTEDMNLLYYYRNRLAGYGLSRLAQEGGGRYAFGQSDVRSCDSQGFLV